MIARLFLRLSVVAMSVVVIEMRAAHAACTISDAVPTRTLPTPMSDGERFVFWASADCATLEFSSGELTRTPVRGPRPGPGPRMYHVNLAPSVWKSLVGPRDTFRWTVTGWTTDGVVAQVTTTNELDLDYDGWTRSDGDAGTCDHDVTRYPGATETCDGIDQDCDGLTDEDATTTWFSDADGDGYGDDSDSVVDSCDGLSEYVALGGDCDDADAAISPAATENCDDVDDDCDGYASCTVSLSDADAEYTGAAGDGAGGGFVGLGGGSVAGAGDVNGDGYDDVLVGAYQNDDGGSDAGAAYLVLGGPSPASASLSAADAVYTGEASGDIAGATVAGAGDVDGDGYDDVLVGAHWNDDGGTTTGAAYLVLGGPSPASLSLSAADAEYTGSGYYENAGTSVAGAGDVNGDGYDDILVSSLGSGYWGIWAGAAYLVLGGPSPGSAALSAADAEYHGELYYDFAYSSAGAGDVDGDGYDDVLVGAKYRDDGATDAGAAYLVLGGSSPASASLSAADAEYTGEAASDWAGGQLAGAGDVDGDGYGDVLVGACNNDDGGVNAGAGYLVLGSMSPASASLSAADAEYTGEAAYDLAGYPVAGAGDVDADGYDDVLVGAVYNDDSSTDAGAAYLVRGGPSPASASLSAADIEHTGAASGDAAGFTTAGAGDVDADGYPDVLVGGALNDDGGTDAGAAYLLLGGGL